MVELMISANQYVLLPLQEQCEAFIEQVSLLFLLLPVGKKVVGNTTAGVITAGPVGGECWVLPGDGQPVPGAAPQGPRPGIHGSASRRIRVGPHTM